MTRRRALLLLLVAACETPLVEPPPPPPPVDTCEGRPPLSLRIAPTQLRANGAGTLEASGGTGRYTFSLEDNVTGATVSGSRYVAGSIGGIDLVRVKDDCGQQADLQVEVRPGFSVQPLRATIRPRTSFSIRVSGATGPMTFAPSGAGPLASRGSISADGVYTAGDTEGLDLIVARDTGSGEQALLQYRVAPTASFRARPPRLAAPSGAVVPLETAEGSGNVTWRLMSGPGVLQGSTWRAVNPMDGGVEGVTGTAVLQVRDEFTQETATASIRVLTELTRPTRAQGRRTDVGTMATGDFNGDGLRDVALGVPESDLAFPQGGAVFIFLGRAGSGLLDGTMNQSRQPDYVIGGDSDTAQLGVVMAVGDLDGDKKDDLAIAEPGADVTISDSGAVVLYRITEDGPERMRPALTGLGRGNFGASLDIADVDGDGDNDLVVGSPGADLAPTGAINSRGVIDLFLQETGRPLADLGTIRLGGQDLSDGGTTMASTNLRAGRALIAKDLNADGRTDIAFLTTVNNSLLGGTPLARNQVAIQIHLGREGMTRIESRPHAYVLPVNTADGTEGTWRLGYVPASGGVGPFLIAAADQADAPNLMAMGGNPAAQNAGGALLFDLKALTAGDPPAQPTQLGRQDAFAMLFGDQANIQAGRSFAVGDLDGDQKPELLLGAPYAATTTTVNGMMMTTPNTGRLLVYSLGALTKGTQLNKTMVVRPGALRTDTLGIAVGVLVQAGQPVLLGYAGRASTSLGDFTGRLDAFSGTGLDLTTWTRTSAEIANTPASQGFGQAVDLTTTAGGALTAIVGVPLISGLAADQSGNELQAGQAQVFTLPAASQPRILIEGAGTRYTTREGVTAFGNRNVGLDVATSDFDGDGRREVVVAMPQWSVPARQADGGVPVTDYAGNRPQCFPAAGQQPGGAIVYHQRADGTFTEGWRVWAPVQIAGCTVPDGGAASVCQRAALSRNGLAGGFDFNGDGLQDLALSRTNGLEVAFGRAPDDGAFNKPSVACDMGYSLPNVPQGTTLLGALGDLNADGCDELGLRYGDRLGFIVVYGFDPSGMRCGGRTEGSWVRVSGDVEAGLPTLRLGVAMARAGRLLRGDTRDFLAVTADLYSFQGVAQPTVLLYDVAQLNQRRPMSGGVLAGALGDGLDPVPLVYLERAPGFGRQLWGGVNLVGDATPDLVVSAPGANVNGDGTGAVFVFEGGQVVSGRNEPAVTVLPDHRERASFGVDLAATAATSNGPHALVIGAPLSYRTGTANGTAFILPLDF